MNLWIYPVLFHAATFCTLPLTWSSCLLKLLKMSCLLTWKTGLPSLKTACMTTPNEYMSEAESQLTDRMYSGARYSGLGRQSGGRLGSHSLHVYLGWGGWESMRISRCGYSAGHCFDRASWRQWAWEWAQPDRRRRHLPTHLGIGGVGGGYAEVKTHDLPGSALVEDDVLWTQVAMDHFHPIVEKGQTLRHLKREKTGLTVDFYKLWKRQYNRNKDQCGWM